MTQSALLAFLCCCTTADGEVHHTADLGWKAGQDVTSEFETLLGENDPQW